MHFAFKSLSADDFGKWIAAAKASGGMLGRSDYLQLERPSSNEPVRLYGAVDRDLYRAILNMCVETGKMCMSEMTDIDAKGGLGREGLNNTLPLAYDKYARRGTPLGSEPTFIAGICVIDELKDTPTREINAPFDMTPLRGVGLKRPPFSPVHPSSTSLLSGQRPKSES